MCQPLPRPTATPPTPTPPLTDRRHPWSAPTSVQEMALLDIFLCLHIETKLTTWPDTQPLRTLFVN